MDFVGFSEAVGWLVFWIFWIQDFRMFGFSDFLVFLRMLVGFFRMLIWIFDIGFGHLVFPDLDVVVC